MGDAKHRVEGAERVLEDHRHLPPIPEQVLPGAQAVQRPASVVDLAPGGRVDPGQQPGHGALAAAALPDQGDDLALPNGEVEIVDGMQHPALANIPPRRKCRVRSTVRRSGSSAAAGRSCELRASVIGFRPPPSPARRRGGSARRHRRPRYSSGSWLRHAGMTSGQRGWKRQPLGGRARSGGAAGDPEQLSARAADRRERVHQTRGCTGAAAARRSRSVRAASAIWPAYITITRSE